MLFLYARNKYATEPSAWFFPSALFRCHIVMDAELLANIKQQVGISQAVFGGSEIYPPNCAEPAHQSQANLLIDSNTKTVLP